MAHEERLRAGRTSQQRARLADGRAEGAAGSADASRQRQGQHDARRQPSDDERRRRHDAPLLGAKLAAQSVGLQGRQRDDEALRRVAHPERIDRRRLAVRPRRARAVLRQGRIRMRRVGTGRQHQGHDRSARQHLRRPAQSRLPDAAAAQHRLHRPDDVGGARPRLASVPRSGVDQLAHLPGAIGVHVSRLLQQGRLPRRREERSAPDDDSARAGDGPPESRDARARHVDRHRCQRPRHRRDLRDRRAGIHPARQGRAARQLHLREHRASCCCRNRRRFRTACRTITARSGATT